MFCSRLVHRSVRICRSGFTLFIVSHMDTRTLTAASHRVYCAALHCLCQQSRVCKARYTKSVESCSRASEFICIHSTACLSSEPILITSSSGLLQQCTSSHPLSLEEEKRAAAGAFLLLWYYSFSSLRGCSSYWFVCCQARLLSSILLSESEEKQWPDLCANTAPPYRVLVVIGLGCREMRHVLI